MKKTHFDSLTDRVEKAQKYSFIEKDDFPPDRKSTRLNSSHLVISYAVFCLKQKRVFGPFDFAAHVVPLGEAHSAFRLNAFSSRIAIPITPLHLVHRHSQSSPSRLFITAQAR